MKNTKLLSILCAGLFTFIPTGQALMAPLGSRVINSEAKAETKTEGKVVPPAENQTAWTPAGSNSKLLTYYDANSLKYDQNTGIITAWTKWVYKSAGGVSPKTVLLLSRYDVRIKVFADLYYINYNSAGTVLKEGPAADQSWANISPNTLGEDMRTALNNYLVSH